MTETEFRQKLNNLAVGAVYDLRGWYGLDVSKETFLELVYSDPEAMEYFKEEVDYPGAYEDTSDGLDTCVRDVVADLIAKSVGETHWPIYAEGDARFKEFYAKLDKLRAAN